MSAPKILNKDISAEGERITEDYEDQESGLPQNLYNSSVNKIVSYWPHIKSDIFPREFDASLSRFVDYTCFVDMSHEIMVSMTAEGFFRSVNERFCSYFDCGEDELEKMKFVDLISPSDRHYAITVIQALMKTENFEEDNVIELETNMRSKEGKDYFIHWRMTKKNSVLYCAGRDLTEIKKHEEELKRREQQLSEAEAIGNMGHWHWKIGNPELSFSDEIYRIFGVDRDKFTPTLDNLGSYIRKRDLGRLIQAFQRSILEGNDYNMEFCVVRSDNTLRYVKCQGRCEKDSDDEVVGLFGIMQDITERVLYEINLKEAKESVEHAYATKSQFLANMSHELRTPLNAIIGFSEIMQEQIMGPIGSKKYMEYIEGIKHSGEHLLDLISDILDMSRIEAGKYDLDLEIIKISKVISGAIRMVDARAQDAGIKLIFSEKDSMSDMEVLADKRAVMQIILNLLSNAIKFTSSGGEVSLSLSSKGEYAVIKVSDNGIGIPANKLKSVTRPFEQVSSQYSRSHEGSGLGLAITKELAEMHGGSIHVDSAVGVGTTVTIKLPFTAVT